MILISDDTGNVGIGTTEPEAMLEISGPGGTSEGTDNVRLRLTTTNDTKVAPGIEFINAFNDNGAKISKMVARDGEAFSFEYSDPDINDHALGNSLMVIETNGNVGIGTTEPSEKLHVVGKVKAQAFDTGDITFRKEGEALWRMFEDEDGLYLESLKTGKVYRFVLEEVEK
jgi:hypothetical protein